MRAARRALSAGPPAGTVPPSAPLGARAHCRKKSSPEPRRQCALARCTMKCMSHPWPTERSEPACNNRGQAWCGATPIWNLSPRGHRSCKLGFAGTWNTSQSATNADLHAKHAWGHPQGGGSVPITVDYPECLDAVRRCVPLNGGGLWKRGATLTPERLLTSAPSLSLSLKSGAARSAGTPSEQRATHANNKTWSRPSARRMLATPKNRRRPRKLNVLRPHSRLMEDTPTLPPMHAAVLQTPRRPHLSTPLRSRHLPVPRKRGNSACTCATRNGCSRCRPAPCHE